MRIPFKNIDIYQIFSTLADMITGGTQTAISVTYTAASKIFNFVIQVDDDGIEVNGSNKLQLKDLGVKTAKINTDAVDKTKIAADVAGSGLAQNVDGSLEVKVDDSTIEINTDTLRVKADGINDTHIDFGTGANQVSAVDIPITDTGTYFEGTEVETALAEIGEIQQYESGYNLNEPDTMPDITFVDSTRTLSVAVKGGQDSFSFYTNGKKFTKTETETIIVPATSGTYYIYFDNDGVLQTVLNASLARVHFIQYATTALIYWNATANQSLIPDLAANERHGHGMDGATHLANHFTLGALYSSGLSISGLTDGGTTYAQVNSGVFFDEDIQHDVAASATNRWLYRDGANGDWLTDTADNLLGYLDGGAAVVWNENTSGTVWEKTALTGNDVTINFFMGVPLNDSGGVVKLVGQDKYSNAIQARAAVETEVTRMNTAGLPNPELIYMYAVIIKANGELQKVDDEGNLFYDLRGFNAKSSGGTSSATLVAADISITDTGDYYTAANVESALQEIGSSYTRKCDKVINICADGGQDYTTIQAALDDNVTEGVIFIINPGTYTNDTIHFTANNQTVKGISNHTIVEITSANANIVDFGAFTGCKITELKASITAATSVVNTVQGSGNCIIENCHIIMTTAYSTAEVQPACFGGTGTFTINFGTIEYNHTGNIGTGAISVKNAILLGDNCTYTINDTIINISGSGTSLGITVAYGTGASTINFNRHEATLTDLNSNYVIGISLGGTGNSYFKENNLHCTAGINKIAASIWITGTPTVRCLYNHLNSVDGGGTGISYSFIIPAGATLISQFDDIVAADGVANLGTYTQVNSETDGTLTSSGGITAETFESDVVTGTAPLTVASTTLVTNLNANLLNGQSTGIADNNLVEIDSADAASGEYAKFTANGLESKSVTEVKTDLSLSNVTDDAQLKIASNLSDVNNQQTSLNNVTAVSGATNEYVLTKDTSTGNAIFKIAAGGGGFKEYGLALANGTDTDHEIDIAAGARWDSTYAEPITYAGGTIDIENSGAGGLDTGSVANSTQYYIWLCKGDSGVTAVFSASASAPTLPSGYDTYKACVGRVITEGSANIDNEQLWTKHADGNETYEYQQATGSFPNADISITHNLGTENLFIQYFARNNSSGVSYVIATKGGTDQNSIGANYNYTTTALTIFQGSAAGFVIMTATNATADVSSSASYRLKIIARTVR